jgi:hypothetical protein
MHRPLQINFTYYNIPSPIFLEPLRDVWYKSNHSSELSLAHKGVKAHDSTMGQDSGAGARYSFTDGNGVSEE